MNDLVVLEMVMGMVILVCNASFRKSTKANSSGSDCDTVCCPIFKGSMV